MLYFPHCNGKNYYQIKDDQAMVLKENTVQYFSNIKVYASDPWYHTFHGKLENLAYTHQGRYESYL